MAIEFNPKPAGDHKTLLQQFNALLRLHNANVNHLALMRGEVAGLLSQIGLLGPSEADSQRDANAEMTTLLEQQEIRNADQAKELARLRTLSSNQAVEIMALREELLIKPGTGETAYRAAADIYYQLVTECDIPEGGSLVTYVDTLRDAADNMVKAMTGEIGMSRKQAVTELVEALDANNQEKPHG